MKRLRRAVNREVRRGEVRDTQSKKVVCEWLKYERDMEINSRKLFFFLILKIVNYKKDRARGNLSCSQDGIPIKRLRPSQSVDVGYQGLTGEKDHMCFSKHTAYRPSATDILTK